MRLRKHSVSLLLLTLLSSALLVGCGVIGASEPEHTPTPDHQAIAEGEVSQIMAARRAARTPTRAPEPTSLLLPTITLSPKDIEAMLAQAALASEFPTTPISQSLSPTTTPSPIPTPDVGVLVEQARPAIVKIKTPTGTGTGTIFSPNGYILTSYHAIAGYDAVDVWVAGGDSVAGAVVGYDESLDLAVVKIDGGPWPMMPITSYAPSVGEEILVVGYGSDQPVTANGEVSALRADGSFAWRRIGTAMDDVPGGGAAFNVNGRFIGVNTDDGSAVLSVVGFSSVADEIPRMMAGGQSLVSTPTPLPLPTVTQTPTPTPPPAAAPFGEDEAINRLANFFDTQMSYEFDQIGPSLAFYFWLVRGDGAMSVDEKGDGHWVIRLSYEYENVSINETWLVFEEIETLPVCDTGRPITAPVNNTCLIGLSGNSTPVPTPAPAPVAQPTAILVPTPTSNPTSTPIPPPTPTPTATPVPTRLYVTKTADTYDGKCDTDCSLRDAIGVAHRGDTIEIPAGTYTLTQDELVISKDLALIGFGPESTILQAAKSASDASQPGAFGVLRIWGGADGGPPNVSVSALAVRHGLAGIDFVSGTLTLNDTTVYGNIRGIVAGGGTLTLNHSAVTENTSGGIYNVQGNLFLNNSIVQGNSTERYGGGIYNKGGSVTITDSTISGNMAVMSGGGIKNDGGTLVITGSTISGNTSNGDGGAIRNDGGTVILTNSTISGNVIRGQGGGLYNGGGKMNLVNTTITANRSESGAGGIDQVGDLTLRNTIVAGNFSSEQNRSDCYGAFTSLGYNLLGTNNGCIVPANSGDLFGFDPLLGPLQENGGATMTHALLPGSPAIDGGDGSVCPSTDQRGITRPQGVACDIGAYEAD